MVNLYVGITDYEWFRYLSALPNVEEVNFWQPGGRTNFSAARTAKLTEYRWSKFVREAWIRGSWRSAMPR
jgi:hypothetical protein